MIGKSAAVWVLALAAAGTFMLGWHHVALFLGIAGVLTGLLGPDDEHRDARRRNRGY